LISKNNILRRLNLLTAPVQTNPLPTNKAGMDWILSLPSLCNKPVIANKISKGAEIEINGLPNLFIKLSG
tara:strand:- start:174 stop:383 length:210 start_codon:yes stop_codon:yes gene_type:complete